MPIDEHSRPNWQLPKGVSRGTWDYLCHKPIAQQYDAYFRDHALLAFDNRVVMETLSEVFPGIEPPSAKLTGEQGASNYRLDAPIVVDLGCGTGRSLCPLADLGWRCLGIDLSQAMLEELAAKKSTYPETLVGVRSNMVQLDCIADQTVDAVLCLFSSLGMVRGRENRVSVIKHAARILNPGGTFILHVHNRWSSLLDPGGPRWLLSTWLRSKRDREWELGDRIYPYRGLTNMFLHIYSYRELEQDLISGGFGELNIRFLNRTDSGWLDKPNYFPHLRSGGFIAVAKTDL